jgi:hypothetical protein
LSVAHGVSVVFVNGIIKKKAVLCISAITVIAAECDT